MSEQSMFSLGDVVRVDQHSPVCGGWKGTIEAVLPKPIYKRFRVALANGETHHYSSDELSLIAAESPSQDAELAALRADVARLREAISPFATAWDEWLNREVIECSFVGWLRRYIGDMRNGNMTMRRVFERAYEALNAPQEHGDGN